MRKENVYRIPDTEFIRIINSSKNIHESLEKMGLNSRGAAYKTFKQRCKKLQIDLSHFKKDSEIRKILSNDDIRTAIINCISRQASLKLLGLNPHIGSNVLWITNKIRELNISCDHWLGAAHLKNKSHSWNEIIPLESILVENSTYTSNASLKKRLLKAEILTYECSKCLISTWRDKPIVLQLEHINGNNSDNRIENLCLLCPNCHSQTDTFAGKNIGKH